MENPMKIDEKTAREWLKYSEQYDAYYDGKTMTWIERRCEDASCEFCSTRPIRPVLPDQEENLVNKIKFLEKQLQSAQYRIIELEQQIYGSR
jgi:hypothetical protein